VNAPFVAPIDVAECPSFLCILSHASLECPPRCGSLDHVADAVNMIGHRPLIDDHTHTPNVQVPAK
jgi:hypothetical protein